MYYPTKAWTQPQSQSYSDYSDLPLCTGDFHPPTSTPATPICWRKGPISWPDCCDSRYATHRLPGPQLLSLCKKEIRTIGCCFCLQQQNTPTMWGAATVCKPFSFSGHLIKRLCSSPCLCKQVYFFVSLYLTWECGQALAKPAFKWQKSLSLNILSLKKPSSRKNICDTWANDEVRSGWKDGSSCRRVRVSPPRVSRNKTSGFSCSNWPLCERPGRKRVRAHLS